jgi:hypothetical protein
MTLIALMYYVEFGVSMVHGPIQAKLDRVKREFLAWDCSWMFAHVRREPIVFATFMPLEP